MKKPKFVLAALALGGSLALASAALTQQPGTALPTSLPPAAGTPATEAPATGTPATGAPVGGASLRVATVNVGHVFTKYLKAKAYKDQLETLMAPHRAEDAKLKKEIIDWTEQMRNPKFDLKDRERYDAGIRNNKRQLEDLNARVGKMLSSATEDQIVGLYREVADAVKAYAQANGIHVVLGYGEQVEGDVFSVMNIDRKMKGMDLGSCNPIYMAQGIDISQAVTDMLNTAFQRTSPAGVTPVSGTAQPNKK